MTNPEIEAMGSWARYVCRLMPANPEIGAMGSWAKYLG